MFFQFQLLYGIGTLTQVSPATLTAVQGAGCGTVTSTGQPGSPHTLQQLVIGLPFLMGRSRVMIPRRLASATAFMAAMAGD